MPVNRSARVETTLAVAVANNGTVDIAYPTGTSQLSFNAGLNGTGGYVMLNDNEKWTEAAVKIGLVYGASVITITNLSVTTWAAGTKLALNVDQVDGNDIVLLTIPINLATITAAGDVVTEIRPGIYGTIEYWEFVVVQPVTTAAKLATLNLEIDTTNVTAGTIALTSAAATPLGKVIPGAAITGANVLVPESKLSIEAASVTAFVEGTGFVVIRIRKTALYNY